MQYLMAHSLFGSGQGCPRKDGRIQNGGIHIHTIHQVPTHDSHSSPFELAPSWPRIMFNRSLARVLLGLGAFPLLRRLSIGTTHTALLSLAMWKNPDMKMKTEGQVCDCSWTVINDRTLISIKATAICSWNRFCKDDSTGFLFTQAACNVVLD